MLLLLSPGTQSLSCRPWHHFWAEAGILLPEGQKPIPPFCCHLNSSFYLPLCVCLCVCVCACTYVHINMGRLLVLLQVPTKTLYCKWLLDLPDMKLPLAMDNPW